MLIQFYPNPNKPAPIVYGPPPGSYNNNTPLYGYEYAQAAAKKITVLEWRRRDKIVREEAFNCELVKGSIVYPTTLAKFEEYGSCKIVAISSTYSDFGDDEVWPASDKPYILHAVGLVKDTGIIQATSNFFSTEFPKE